MCLICIEFQKQRMTREEANRAFTEMISSMEEKHAREVREMLKKAEEEERRLTKET